MRYSEIIKELRRNPDKNIKTSPSEQLAEFAKDPDAYLSMTKIDKIGINPHNDYNTPIGIYTYPADYAYGQIGDSNNFKNLPYAGEHPYAWIIKPTKPRAGLNLNTYAYGMSDFDHDSKLLRKFLSNRLDEEDIEQVLGMGERTAIIKEPGGYIWNTTRLISLKLSSGDNTSYLPNGTKKSTIIWNRILMKVLGYPYAADHGEGIIHEYEPTQAVFFDVSAFNTLERIDLKREQERGPPKKFKKIDRAANVAHKTNLIQRPKKAELASVNIDPKDQGRIHRLYGSHVNLGNWLRVKNLLPAIQKQILSRYSDIAFLKGKEFYTLFTPTNAAEFSEDEISQFEVIDLTEFFKQHYT